MPRLRTETKMELIKRGRNMSIKPGELAKEYLNRPYFVKQRIHDKQSEIEQLESLLGNKAVQLKKDKVKSSNIGGAEPDIIAKIVDLKNEIDKLYEKYNRLMLENKEIIESITDDIYRSIIYRRFCGHKHFWDIAQEIGYSERQVYRKYQHALEWIEKNILCDIES